MITLLDYGAGNVRSVRNAITRLGYTVRDVQGPEDILSAEKLIFPGVGSFGSVMQRLKRMVWWNPSLSGSASTSPFFGICVALQALFEGSEESPGVAGLSILPGQVKRFTTRNLSVPQIGWNGIVLHKESPILKDYHGEKLYFVHSYRASIADVGPDWLLATTDYGDSFVSGVEKGNVTAFQFHPEKSGEAGLGILKNYLDSQGREAITVRPALPVTTKKSSFS